MSIDRDTWEQIGPLFDRLLDRPASERDAVIGAAGLSAEHRAALENLLTAHDTQDADDELLTGSAADLLGLPDAHRALSDWSGRTLGPWRVERRLAEGGMSVVYVGERADGRFEMQVAIKVLKTGRLNIAPERLDAETRILARLQHPGIARLIDSGAGEDGQPYLVMEFIDGTPIDRHCATQNMTTRDRVRQVLAVAEALEYAHQRQVVHCDIKPANVLVRTDGRPCIVDFGIAALAQRGDPDTEQAHRFCSPGFSAPECYDRAPPDTAQDVYSLGALLSELVVDGGVRALSDTITGQRTPTEDLVPAPMPAHDGSGRLPADLAAVLRRARAHEPESRYPSVGALAADLRAWLDHRPVAAFDGGRVYAVGKWFRRHRLAATLGLLAALSLIGGAGVALHQAGLARDEAARALAVRDFTVGLFEAADPAREDGEDPPASVLLQRGAERVGVDLADQPGVQAEMLHVIGGIQLQRGLILPATDTLDRALALIAEHDVDPAIHARALSDRGMVAFEQGDLDASIEWMNRARERAARARLPPSERAYHDVHLADMHVIREEPESALALVEPWVDIDDPELRAYALRVKGGALERADRFEDAAATLQQALDVQADLDPNHVFYAFILEELAIVRWRQRLLQDAADLFQRSVDHKQRVLGDVHPQTLTALGNLATVRTEQGDLVAAERAWLEQLDALTLVHGDEPHPAKGYTHGMLAWTLYRRGAYRQALGHAREGHRITEALEGEHPMVRWVPAMTGLAALEFREPDAADLLGPWGEDCAVLDGKRELGLRFCLARAWLAAATAAGECAPGLPPSATEETMAALPERWQAVHGAVTEICAGRPITPTDALPRWVQVAVVSKPAR
ncbi:serine/threonine protein kinase [Wenzhouxiangella sp. XN79A]|uniref:serine/threonine-protein kinase n=1 Tax=Wenzhouxiangella sp. XN79A TaxID=2724193 RepID=UPI00144A6006|nr:serine/threonine-protein kinase [Wenzhouxiangella sp. XN79A]NKI34351.1 serine/threonine protein kinase [Wenzhouxiangella sp. XN79A]